MSRWGPVYNAWKALFDAGLTKPAVFRSPEAAWGWLDRVVAATVLRPERAGTDDGVDLYLVDADTGVKIADTAGVYTDLVVEDLGGTPIAEGDTVGELKLWDGEGHVRLPVTGKPAETRLQGVGPCTTSDYVGGLYLPDAAQCSVAVWFEIETPGGAIDVRAGLFCRASNVSGSWSLSQFWSGFYSSDLLFQAAGQFAIRPDTSSTSDGDRLCFVWEWDDTTPGGSDGTVKWAVYTDAGVLIDNGTNTYALSSISARHGTEMRLGLLDGTRVYARTGLRAAIYEGATLITSGGVADVVSGTDETAGGLRTAHYAGIVSGVEDLTDATRLTHSAGPGVNAITAREHP